MVAPARTSRPWYSRIWPFSRQSPAPVAALAKTPKRQGLTLWSPKGWQGIRNQGGIIDHDHNPALANGAWRGDASTMGEGKRLYYVDPEFRAATKAVIYPHLANTWRMKPADADDPLARMIAGAAEDMVINQPEWRKQQLDRFMCLRDGVRLQEQEWTFDGDFVAHEWTHEGDRVKRWVKQTTGRKGLYVVKFHPRLPHTIQEWKTNPDGSFGGILQSWRDDDTGNHDQVVIPAEMLSRWTCDEEGNNWEGDPIGRPAWGPCNLRRDMINDFGVMVYRFAYGSPGFEESEANLDLDDEALSRLDTIAREYAADPHQFIRTPYGVRFVIHEAKLQNGDFFWKLYDGLGRQIHRLHGTQYVFSGEGYGSRSEHDSKHDVSLFTAMNYEQIVAGPINELMPRWCEWNGWPARLAPTLVSDDLQSKSAADLAQMLKTASDAGFLTRQNDDEVMLRKAGSLPDLTDDAVGEAEEKQRKAEDIQRAQLDAAKTPDETPPPPNLPNDTGDDRRPSDGQGAAGLSSSCGCAHALGDRLAANRVWKPHPGHEASIRHAMQFGPMAALAEEFFDGASSRTGRERRIQTTARGLVPIVERLAEKYAAQVEGKTIGEAAKAKIKDADLVEIRRYLTRQYKATARIGQDEVKREIREQKDDPTYAERFVEAKGDGEGAEFAFATLGDKAGKKGQPQEIWEQLDFDDYLRGVSRTTADAIAQQVQVTARNAVQGAAIQGGASAAAIATAVAVDLTPRTLAGFVQPDVQGVYAKGRLVQFAREAVPWGVYTNSPELSSEVCDPCIDRASDSGNPFEMSNAAAVQEFEVPNPDCLGGQNCWCVVIGLTQPPEDPAQMREDAVGAE